MVRVPPERFGEPLKETIEDILRRGYDYRGYTEGGYEGKLDKNLGVILAITKIIKIGEGKIVPGDGAVYHDVTFEALVFKPELHEVVEAEVVEVVNFGAFVRFGPLDGLIHVSQIMDDYIVYDKKREVLIGKQTNRVLMPGDKVRARIVTISLNPDKKETKINLTMRQPGLGKLEWIEEEKKAMKEKAKEKVKAGGK